MRKSKTMKAGIVVFMALMLSVGVTIAQQIQRSNIAENVEKLEGEQCSCEVAPWKQYDDPKDMLCPMISEAAPLIYDMLRQGVYDLRDGNDSLPSELIEERLIALEEWCAGGPEPDWENGEGFDFHLLTALVICMCPLLILAGIPYYIVSFFAVNFLIGLGLYTIILMIEIEFGLDYAEEIWDAYWHCVDLLT